MQCYSFVVHLSIPLTVYFIETVSVSLSSYSHKKIVFCQMGDFHLLFVYPSKRKGIMDMECFLLCLNVKCVVQSACRISYW
jgi:hypothetical protein